MIRKWPSDDRPECSDYLLIQTPEEHGKLLGVVQCGPFVVGVPTGTRTTINQNVFVARFPGGRPAEAYFDPETGSPAAWAMPRLHGANWTLGTDDAELLDLVRMGVTSVTHCGGFERMEIGTKSRD